MKGVRIDKYIAVKYPDLSRAKIQKLIKSGGVFVEGKRVVKSSFTLSENDDVEVDNKVLNRFLSTGGDLVSEEFDFDVLYEDEECFVLDKPAGVVMHPGEGETHLTGTLANAIMDKVDSDAGEKGRPGIVHRLDKDTSGAVLIAKTKESYDFFVSQFKEGKVEKEYVALVFGEPEHSVGKVDSPIGRSLRDRKKMAVMKEGRPAVTEYEVEKIFESYDEGVASLLKVKLPTGKTHQIRVHMSAIGYPVVGDDVYGETRRNKKFEEEFGLKRQFLHAEKLVFVSPCGDEKVSVTSPLSSDLKRVLSSLRELS